MANVVKVSVIVPVYNVEKYLEKCISSLVNQTLHEIEIILVDDGSTDQSSDICDEFERKYENIRVIHKKNAGLGMARNSGLKIAKGEYVGFVDSDDYVSYDMYKVLYENALKYGADISYGKDMRFWKVEPDCNIEISDLEVEIYEEDKLREYILNRIGMSPESQKDMLYEPIVCSGIFKRELILRNKVHFVSEREIISEDIIFDIDVLPLAKKIVHNDVYVYFYRSNPKSLTMRYRSDRFSKNIALYEVMERKLSSLFNIEECYNSLARYFIAFTRVCLINEIAHIKENGITTCRKNILVICKNPKLKDILERYDYKKMPFKYSSICCLMKWNCAVLLVICIYIHQFIKGKL